VSGRRLAIIVAAAVLVLVGIGAVVLLTTSEDAADYDDQTRANFIESCTADGGEPVEPACVCWYDNIVEEIPYDRFEEVSDQLVALEETDPDAEPQVPDELLALLEPCKLEPTTTTTTAGG
jgi:hypothetical protein